MPIVEPPPPLPEDASPGQRELHAQAVERWLTEGGRPVTPRANEDATMAALRETERDHQRFLSLHQPITASLKLALMRTKEELEARATSTTTPAIIAIGEAQVRKAIEGDGQAFKEIAERLEGKPGNRAGDVDPEADARRADMATAIEATVRALTDGKRNRVVEGEVTEVVEK